MTNITTTLATVPENPQQTPSWTIWSCADDRWASEHQYWADEDANAWAGWQQNCEEWSDEYTIDEETREWVFQSAEDIMEDLKGSCELFDPRDMDAVARICGHTAYEWGGSNMNWAWMLADYPQYVQAIAQSLLLADEKGAVDLDARSRAEIEKLAA